MNRLQTITALGATALLLGGCSWLPFGGKSHHSSSYKTAHHAGSYGAHHGAYAAAGHCQIPHMQAPIPQGCDPASVTVGLNKFPQQPHFGAGYGSQSYATGGYGSHAGAHAGAAGHMAYERSGPKLRKPKWRGTLSAGLEKSVRGDLLNYDNFPGINPANGYNPDDYAQGTRIGTPGQGQTSDIVWTAETEEISQPTISWDDVYSTPFNVSAGLEYIVSPRTALFANAGYTVAEGQAGNAVNIQSSLFRTTTDTTYVTDGQGNSTPTGTVTDSRVVRNVENTASFAYDFSDLRRIDLEAGARHYLKPLASSGMPKVTPFVGASAGASHFSDTSFTISQKQAFYDSSFADGTTDGNTYDVIPSDVNPSQVDLYDSQWVPRGQLSAGLEWQATPRTALAFETGVRVEGGRKYTNGEREGENVTIPFTIRGSYNF